jgi:hypothetical protein
MSSYEGFEVRHPVVFDHQVSHKYAKKTEFYALWNQIRFGNAREEWSKLKHGHEDNKSDPT